MRRIHLFCLGLSLAAGLSGLSSTASAGSYVDACHRPPPAWYTGPRLSYTYSQSWGAGYARASTHEYSAQRRYSYASQPRRYRDPFRRW